jgi:uncharacterized glyoxalase superfamily protein PhnB
MPLPVRHPASSSWSSDIHAAHEQLKANGVDVSDVDVQAWGHFVHFADPDGNKWAVQYIPQRPNG